jgi:D-alanyl-D-alanine carboxypeptidase
MRNRKVAAAAAVATALAAALLAPSALAATAPTRADVQRAFDRVVAAGVPGATGVIRGPHGVERYSAGLADVRRGVAISTRDHERVASVTKAFTSTVVLQLVARGRMGLDDSVESLLPGVVPDGDQITVRQLLNMSSGLADYCSVPAVPGGPDPCNPPQSSRSWAPQELVDIGVSAPRTFAPGQGWAYTNTGYQLLGMIIERVTGNSLAAEYRQRIFRRLRLTDTQYAPETVSMPKPYSRGYDVLAAGSWPADVTEISPSIAGAAGGLVSTPDDLERFIRAYVGGRLVPARLVAEMRIATPGSLNGEAPSVPLEGGGVATYGLGLEHYTWSHSCGTFGHGGSIPGYHTYTFATDDGSRGAAMFLNADVLEAPGVIAANTVQRLVACRMRFGDIGDARG